MATNAEIVAQILAGVCPKCTGTLTAVGIGGTFTFVNAWKTTLGFMPKLVASYANCGIDEATEVGYLVYECQKCSYKIRLNQSISAWSGVTGLAAQTVTGDELQGI